VLVFLDLQRLLVDTLKTQEHSQEKKVGEKSHIITPGKKGKRAFKKAIGKLR
jgi:hypothetical protein